MNSIWILIIALVCLAAGYLLYGRYLCKQWGVGEGNLETPAHTMEDGVDYVPAKAPVLMGHHFSSIAGAGPITGPINAAIFGWLPCLLWIIIGGIFFGGVHDFGALFASVRHGGKSIGEIISANMSKRAKRLFIIFAYLTLILVVAAFASIVASTFAGDATEAVSYNAAGEVVEAQVAQLDENGAVVVDENGAPVMIANAEVAKTETKHTAAAVANAQVAMVSILFIVIAIVFGFLVYRRNAPMGISTIIGVVAIAAIIVIGINFHPIYLSNNAWMWIVGLYITIASITPVWILLQPRDYLSSFLLYAMLALALIGVIVGHPDMVDAEGKGLVAFGGLLPKSGSPVFPVLFTTIACGAISGFHSLVSSGTTSKQLDKETDAKPIAYGGMLLECVLAVLTLCAVAKAKQLGLTGATNIFGGGIAAMVAGSTTSSLYNVLKTLLILTYSAFCLTSLDTATRLARFMFQEFWLDGSKGETPKNVTGIKKVLTNPLVATLITVILGVLLGLNGYGQIWALFGSANQLLAGLGLLAIATWLGNAGKNNKMFLFPMAFMMVVTLASLVINCIDKISILGGGAEALAAAKLEAWGAWAQIIIGVLLIVLAVILCIEGVQTIMNQMKKKKA